MRRRCPFTEGRLGSGGRPAPVLQAVEMRLLQRLVDVKVRALAERGLIRHGLGCVGAGSSDDLVQAAFRPTAPVWAVDAAATAATTVAA